MELLEPPKEGECEMVQVLAEACRILDAEGIPYVVGGGLAQRAYGRARPLKDTDVFMPKEKVFHAMNVLTAKGGFHTRDTDATWLFKALKGDILVDLIVRNAGDLHVDAETLRRACPYETYGYTFRIMGPEDILVRKILSAVEGRPHLYDALSIMGPPAPAFDWEYVYQLAMRSSPLKVLGFLLWAEGELGQSPAPDSIVCRMMDGVMADKLKLEHLKAS
jgi:hypothetical protein